MIKHLFCKPFRTKIFLLTALLVTVFSVSHAQELKLGSNPTVIHKSAILELESNTRGLLLPRIPDTSAAPLPASPDGMLIYFTVDSSVYVRKGGKWQRVADKNNLYQLTGPAGGDLTGAYPNPQIAPLAVTTAKLADGSVTYGKLQNIGANNTLLGRYSSGAGTVQQITLGSGLSLNATTGLLSATGSGGTVTSVSAAVPTGLSVNVTNPTTTPNIAVTTTLNGPLRGDGSGFATGNINLASEVNGLLPVLHGGTGLGALGTASQQLRVNAGATALEYFTPVYDTTNIPSFFTKVRGLFSGTAPITYANGAIGITQANTSTSGYLSNTDWNTFNNKLSTIDTTNIASFSVKVRSLFNAGSGLTYNAATGTFTSTLGSQFWQYGGNAPAALQNLGTTSAIDLPIITSGTERMRVLSTGNVGIGLTDPAYPLGVNTNMEIRRSGSATVAQLLFTNVSGVGSGDFRIGSDGTDIYWQGGGGRNLQMGAFWGTFLTGDRAITGFPALVNGTTGTSVTAVAGRASSVPFAVMGVPSQTGNLQEWRSSAATLNVMNPNGNLAIGATAFDLNNPEKVLINAGTTTSVNALYMRGSINNYFQANIRNTSTGNLASSDLVATADNGTESTNFMDMGINGSGYQYQSGAAIETGKANDTYILGAGQDMYIVNNNATKNIIFLSGGTATTDETMRLTADNRVGIATSNPTDTLTVGGPFRMGANGTRLAYVIKSTIKTPSAISIGGNGGTAHVAIPLANTVAGSTVMVSPAADLPDGVSIAYAYVSPAGSIRITFVNAGVIILGIPVTQTIPVNTVFNVTVIN